MIAGHGYLPGGREVGQPTDELDPASSGDYAYVDFREAESGVLACEPEVTGHRGLKPAETVPLIFATIGTG